MDIRGQVHELIRVNINIKDPGRQPVNTVTLLGWSRGKGTVGWRDVQRLHRKVGIGRIVEIKQPEESHGMRAGGSESVCVGMSDILWEEAVGYESTGMFGVHGFVCINLGTSVCSSSWEDERLLLTLLTVPTLYDPERWAEENNLLEKRGSIGSSNWGGWEWT